MEKAPTQNCVRDGAVFKTFAPQPKLGFLLANIHYTTGPSPASAVASILPLAAAATHLAGERPMFPVVDLDAAGSSLPHTPAHILPRKLVDPRHPLQFLDSLDIDRATSLLLMQEHRDPLVAALRYAKSDPTGSVAILVGTHRPPGAERRLIRPDPADENNSQFNLLELIRGNFSASEEKTLFRLREVLYMDMGAALVLPMLRRCDYLGNFSIMNVTKHTSKETDPPEVEPASKILRTITESLEHNCTLVVTLSAPATNLCKAIVEHGKPLLRT